MSFSAQSLARAYPEVELAMETISIEHSLAVKMHILLVESSEKEDQESPSIIIQYSSGYRVKLEPIKSKSTGRISWFRTVPQIGPENKAGRALQALVTLTTNRGVPVEEPLEVRAISLPQLLIKISKLFEATSRIRVIPIPNPIIEDDLLEKEGEQ